MRILAASLMLLTTLAFVPGASADDCDNVPSAAGCFVDDAFGEECFSPGGCLSMYLGATFHLAGNTVAIANDVCYIATGGTCF